ncbi:hypothetical protein EDI_149970 [Entamoeba dispar SAW760]|uniref:Uncharacterized protein n=1 Tax=Entamoeba dispar (strain ATCC PRA-260 / SAW760) TaxID=370354 RepID=B0EHJ0_ENTDS|nr:uncharacterized protein EDI_149970 [Entamoeba dispar SAW760]EDR26007.1 hypothetical protein EDI_149970 [Entamoeba dispar SAW760]|eukprot:EDR26007.1 hypothetical protein EDI_149970 [Entamoeba dispar SAW760]
MKHNTNVHPRNKVEFRKRKSKEVFFNEIAPFQMKKYVISERSKNDEDKIINDDNEIIEEDNVEERMSSIHSHNSIIKISQNETYINEIHEYDNILTEIHKITDQ